MKSFSLAAMIGSKLCVCVCGYLVAECVFFLLQIIFFLYR